MDREDAVAAALRLQLMASNLQVLGQFATSLNRMSCEVLYLAIGPEVFPFVAVDSLSSVPERPTPLTICLLWDHGGARVIPDLCRPHLAIAL